MKVIVIRKLILKDSEMENAGLVEDDVKLMREIAMELDVNA